jgi:hypothetical protein
VGVGRTFVDDGFFGGMLSHQLRDQQANEKYHSVGGLSVLMQHLSNGLSSMIEAAIRLIGLSLYGP